MILYLQIVRFWVSCSNLILINLINVIFHSLLAHTDQKSCRHLHLWAVTKNV